MKKALGIFGIFGIFAAMAAGLLLWPTLQVKLSNATGHGWNEAKSELDTQFIQVLTEEYATFELPGDVINNIATCISSKAIAFLNNTDCSYLYNEITTKKEDHLANQEACFKKVKYEENESNFTIQCTQQLFPDNWKYMRQVTVESFKQGISETGANPNQIDGYANCVADKLVVLLNNRKCPLVNKKAVKAEDMFNPMDNCIKDPDKDPEFDKIIQSCTPLLGLTEAPADEAAPTGEIEKSEAPTKAKTTPSKK